MRKPVPFGKYCLLERISVGGMAEVFKAKQFGAEGFAKTIAIKRILPNMAEDQEFITMFIDEAKIAVQLNHANICQIYELGKIFSSHYIVMEYIPGKDLLQINNHFKRNRKRMPLEMACYVVSKVCEGLDYAHRKRDQNFQDINLVHRDISPQNVLVSHGGEVKIIDFGIAKAATRSTKTQVGVLKGKFGYMSPEQVRGLPLDRRSDIFAAGTVLYEILTAKRLFIADTDFATLEKVRKVDIDPPSKIRPDIPEELKRIIMKALAREREERYQWASEFQEDLQRFLVHSSRPYASHQMSEWMGTTFADEVAKTKEKDEYYATIRAPGDLRDDDEPSYDPFDVDQLEEKGEATVIYAQSDQDEDPRPDFALDIEDRVATPLSDAAMPAMTEEVDLPPDGMLQDGGGSQIENPSTELESPLARPELLNFDDLDDDGGDDGNDEEPTQAVSGISDAQFDEIMAETSAPPPEPEPEPEGPAPTPLAIPRKPAKKAANTMALSADEIEVLVDEEEELAGAADPSDPVPPPGAPLGDLFDDMPPPGAAGGRIDATGQTFSPDEPLQAVPRDPLPKIPSIVKNPERPAPQPPAAAPVPAPIPVPVPVPAPVPLPVTTPNPALAASGAVGFGETMMPPAVTPPPASAAPPAAIAPQQLPPPPAIAPPQEAVFPPSPSPAGPAPFAEQGTGPAFTATSKRRRLLREVVIGTIVAGIILAGGVAAWWFFLGGSQAAVAPGTASLLLEVTPSDGLEIKLDGSKVGDATPARLDGLSPGRHKLEVRADGHLPHKVELELPDGELATHAVELQEGEQPVGQLKLVVRPPGPGTTVSLEGASFGYDPDGPSAWMDLTAAEPHSVVISRKGFVTKKVEVTLTPQEKKSLEVTLEELLGSIKVTSKPSGARVFLNDKKAGKTPFTKKGLNAAKSYDIILTRKGYEDWLDTAQFTSERPDYAQQVELVRKGKKGKKGKKGPPSAGAAASGVGYLTVSAGSDVWAKVLVDGQDTGRSTPIQSYNKLELPVGAHTVTLKLGDKTLDKTVEITAGETTKLRTKLR